MLPRLNAAEMFVDVVKQRGEVGVQWIAESGILDLYVFTGTTPQSVLASYAKLSGGDTTRPGFLLPF